MESGPKEAFLRSEIGYARSMIPDGISTDSVVDQHDKGKDDTEDLSLREDGDGSLHEDEERAIGHVKAEIYALYAQQAGGGRFLASLLAVLAVSIANIG